MTGLADVPAIDWHAFDALSGVVEEREFGMCTALLLTFGKRLVRFEALGEDDTLLVLEVDDLTAPPPGPPRSEVHNAVDLVLGGLHSSDPAPTRAVITREDPWRRFVGASVLWGRAMINHHGYLDGYQLEFSERGGAVGDCIEIVVIASRLSVGTSHFGDT